MIHSAHAGVKAPARTEHSPFRQIPFAFRAYPTALDGLRLPRTARDVFVLLLDNARSRGWRSRLTNAAMASVLGCTTMTIKRALAALEAAGLVLREFVAGGRVRTGVVVTWEGVEHSRSTGRMDLEQPRSTGGTSLFQGVEHPRSTNQSPPQSGDQTGPILPNGEDPESQVPDGPTAARMLRAMIAKGRERQPAPAAPIAPAPAAVERPAAKPAEPRRSTPPPSGPQPRQDDARRIIEQMVAGVFKDARHAAWGPLPGRRRMTPAELQRQLAEVRLKRDGR